MLIKEDFKSTTNYLQQEVGGGNGRWVEESKKSQEVALCYHST
jgi:hypothetical protein